MPSFSQASSKPAMNSLPPSTWMDSKRERPGARREPSGSVPGFSPQRSARGDPREDPRTMNLDTGQTARNSFSVRPSQA